MILAAMTTEQVATIVGGILLGIGTIWNRKSAKSAEEKVERRTQHVDTKLEQVDKKIDGTAVVATTATSIAVDAKRSADEYERMTAIIAGIAASNDDLRAAYRDVKYELAQAQERDRNCQAQLLLLRQEMTQRDERVRDLEREVTSFAAQVAQLTAIVNGKEPK